MRLLLLASLVASALWAQQPRLTLEQALQQTLERNGVRESLRHRVDAASGQQLQAGLKPNPLLTLQSENTRAWGRPGFVYPRDADTFLFLTQRIESAGKRERRIEFAGENVRRTELEQNLFERQLKFRVRSAYWQAAAAQGLVGVAEEQVRSFAALVENNRLRVREGVLAEGDLLRSEVELRRIEAARDLAQGEARRLSAILFREMGFPDASYPQLDPVELGPALTALPETGQRAELNLARASVRAAGANVKLQQANSIPDPLVVYGYKRTAGYNTLIAGLQFDLRLRNKNQGAIAAATADVRAAEAQSRAVAAQVESEVNAARVDYETRRKMVTESLPRIRVSASESMRLTRGAYREGGLDLLRLIDAERVYLETETLYMRALADLKQAEAALEYAMGVDR